MKDFVQRDRHFNSNLKLRKTQTFAKKAPRKQPPEVLCKRGAFKYFPKFKGKLLYRSLFYKAAG